MRAIPGSTVRRSSRVRVVLAAALLVGSGPGSRPPPTPEPTSSPGTTSLPTASGWAATDCAAFAPDPSGEFFTPVDVSYDDPTPLDWPTGTPADVGLDASLLAAGADNVALSADV